MSAVENFIEQFENQQNEILHYFHHLLTTEFNLTDKIRFNIPFYYGKSWVCYLNPLKDSKIEFAFLRGNELSNNQEILTNKGRKQVYSFEANTLSEFPLDLLKTIIHEAILLDETKPYPSKNKKRS